MFKPMLISLVAALIAGAATLWTASGEGSSVASPIVSPAQASAESPATHCEKRAWPYMHCVGTPAGNLRVRLVTTDRLTR
ncbi:MAG TPA: hypothetical protein VHD14_10345 [Pseudolabrys sp.]|jgi:hypothetical protein|nr:hypothetical protein [Pseudolabrys sp.]